MFEMSVVSIPLPPTGKGMETLFKQLRAVFFPAVAIRRREAPRSSASHGRPVWVPIAGEIGTLGDSSRLAADLKMRSVTEGSARGYGKEENEREKLLLPITA